ncbi:MAG: DNA ligase [Candidatus Altiarchaeales archaeon HGW-Altiarchaeales-1]|nr:MAG: DNA ligase [Candidatus Altiarchaeales archaeon HGW-Altiarchaeales-1]
MDFIRIAEIFDKIDKENITSRIELTKSVAKFIADISDEDLQIVLLFFQGKTFPIWSNKELGIAENLVVKALSKTTGWSEEKIKDKIREEGDLGNVAGKILSGRIQHSLFSSETENLTVREVSNGFQKISECSGGGSQDKKMQLIDKILSKTTETEAKFFIRLLLREMRVGIGEGVIRDAIAKSYNVDSNLVERGYYLISDIGEVARIAKTNGKEGLENIVPEIGIPVRVMLAQKVDGVKVALCEFGKCAFEVKYDGMRIQIQKNKGKIYLFTRRLENVTAQFPEIVRAVKENVKADNVIMEGETVAIQGTGQGEESERRKPRVFQELSRRIKRKYDIDEIASKIPVEINLFDILYLNGKSLLNEKFENRRKILENTVRTTETFRLAEQIITDSIEEAEKFYNYAQKSGHEGVMAKKLDAVYQAGSRVGYMYKIKPVMETLDVVIVGGTWGEGKRAQWLASFLLAVREPISNKFLTIGRLGTGFTDEQFKEMTENLRELITREEGKDVEIRPSVVIEVAYEEIQKSPSYTSGYALRFPRLVRFRGDKSPEEADTVERVEELSR